MSTSKFTTSLKPIWQFVLYASAIFIAVISFDLLLGAFFQANFILENVKEEVEIWIIVFFSLVFIGSLLSILYAYHYELEINETSLAKRGLFSSYSFTYDQVDEIFVDVMLVIIKTKDRSISLGNLYSEYEKPLAFISQKLEGRTDITFKGKPKRIKRYFPWVTD